MNTGAAIASAAAAARRLMEHEEEEAMTDYQAGDLADDWEFKILRCWNGAFGKPEKFRSLLDDEARAGWVLVEKFDDNRIRLKRPASARAADAKLDFAPYRSHAGTAAGKYTATVLAIAFGIAFALIALINGIVAALEAGGVIR